MLQILYQDADLVAVNKPVGLMVHRSEMERPALTRYRRLASVELPFPVGRYASCRYSLLSVFPLSGRMHEIRRHLKHLSHPIIGDRIYGDNRHNRFFMEKLGCSRLLLQAVELRLPHPVRGDAITIVAGLDGAFGSVIRGFGWQPSVPAGWVPEAEVKRESEIGSEPRLTVFRRAEGPFEEVQ